VSLFLIVALPLAAAVLTPPAARFGRRAALGVALSAAAASFALLAAAAPGVLAGEVTTARYTWVPAFDLALALRLDGLSLLFAGLVVGIGLLVLVYSAGYLDRAARLERFLALMLAFMGGMLGIVLAENVIILALAWEITSLSSFLLIAFHHREAAARRAALIALTVTGAGGLTLLGGVLLTGFAAGSFALSDILVADLATHPLAPTALVLIVLAAFTKSAQLPLQFWLPAAMVAPTPVSAYLHSAAMVKAGVYLLSRFWPVFADAPLWTPLVGGVGLATMLGGAWLALAQRDIKALLAYSTISHLGMMVMLLGLGTTHAVVAAVFHVLNHALFKAPLFMLAGAIDHATGVRELDRLGGLWRLLPVVGVTGLVGIAAMGGLPPLNGYISKEMMLGATTDVGAPVAALATLGAGLSAAYAVVLAWRGFLAPPGEPARTAHRPSPLLVWPAVALVAGAVAVGLAPEFLAGGIVHSAAVAAVGHGVEAEKLALWHGPEPAFWLGLAALAGGLVVAGFWPIVAAATKPLPDAVSVFQSALARVIAALRRGYAAVHNGVVARYLAVLVAVLLVVGYAATGNLAPPSLASAPPLPAILGLAVLAAATFGAVRWRARRVMALVLVSTVGLTVALAFAYLSAPDVALTQLTVEIVTTVLVLLAIRLLPAAVPRPPRRVARAVQAALAVATGAGAAALAFAVMTAPGASIIARDVIAQSLDAASENLVHLILVDYRAFDTFGEISVLMIAALGAYALVHGFIEQRAGEPVAAPTAERAWDVHPLQFRVAARLLMPLALLVAVFFFVRGEAHPGGGFVAGLVAAVAVLIQYMANGVAWTERRAPISHRAAVASGVLLAVLTGLWSLLRGAPFLTQAAVDVPLPGMHPVHLSTVMVFDLGVALTVVGATLLALVNIARIETRASAAS
jgi:multicomponent K+:H+ antiporter subunit A